MKFILILLLPAICLSQTIKYNKIDKEGTYQEYISKNNQSIKIGDTININYPSTPDKFIYITQGNQYTGTVLNNTKIVVYKIKTIGNKNRGYKTFLLFKGFGLLPIFIEYESALDKNEIK